MYDKSEDMFDKSEDMFDKNEEMFDKSEVQNFQWNTILPFEVLVKCQVPNLVYSNDFYRTGYYGA